MIRAKLTADGKIDWLERAAVGASLACLVHCLALPLLLAALPALSCFISLPESFHGFMVAIAVPASSLALIKGMAAHRGVLPAMLGATGLVFLVVAAFMLGASSLETPITVAGSLLLASAHVFNWRMRHG
jgi:hypothetical protein